jgi:GMP synthase-like glutamine amidotransferase
MHIHCLQHVPYESPGSILEWAAVGGHTMSCSHLFEADIKYPPIAAIDVLLIMGGSMSVNEEAKYPWLKVEKAYIKSVIDAGKKVIGICLGAQLIASVLGAAVYKGKQTEIGFFRAKFTSIAQQNPWFAHFPENYTLFHWHGDTFDLPERARLMASTRACRNQAFVVGENVLALQFHPEMTVEAIEQMLQHDGAELNEKGKYIQCVDAIRKEYAHLERNKKDLFVLLDKFLEAD